jgi:hypothetical protein
MTATNVVVKRMAQRGFDISGQASWSMDGVWSVGNGSEDAPGLSDPHFRNVHTTMPDAGACKVFTPPGSPAKGSGGGGEDIGASILYRYQDGALTKTPLWNSTTGAFTGCGVIVPGVNDVAGSSCFDVHTRLNVNTNGCKLPTAKPPIPTPKHLQLLPRP